MANEEFVTTDEVNLSDDILRDILPHMKKHGEEECRKHQVLLNQTIVQTTNENISNHPLVNNQLGTTCIFQQLNKEIVYKAISKRDSTINLLLTERNNISSHKACLNEQQDLNKKEFVYPKRNVKTQYTHDKKTISLSNRYDDLNDYEISSLREHSDYDVIQSYIHKPNPTKKKEAHLQFLGTAL